VRLGSLRSSPMRLSVSAARGHRRPCVVGAPDEASSDPLLNLPPRTAHEAVKMAMKLATNFAFRGMMIDELMALASAGRRP
jgi:hypothetical protein